MKKEKLVKAKWNIATSVPFINLLPKQPSIHPFNHPSFHPSMHPSTHPSIQPPSKSTFLSFHKPPISHLSMHSYVHYHPFTYLSIHHALMHHPPSGHASFIHLHAHFLSVSISHPSDPFAACSGFSYTLSDHAVLQLCSGSPSSMVYRMLLGLPWSPSLAVTVSTVVF